MKTALLTTLTLVAITSLSQAKINCAISGVSVSKEGEQVFDRALTAFDLSGSASLVVDPQGKSVRTINLNQFQSEDYKNLDGQTMVTLNQDSGDRVAITVTIPRTRKFDKNSFAPEMFVSGIPTRDASLALILPKQHIAISCQSY
jgi:hypothetical protein